jgi:hypothetical protein
MRTTIDIPDDLFRRCKATAALRGDSLKALVAEALRVYLERGGEDLPARPGWRSVYGLASREEVASVDAAVDAELERIEPEEWR